MPGGESSRENGFYLLSVKSKGLAEGQESPSELKGLLWPSGSACLHPERVKGAYQDAFKYAEKMEHNRALLSSTIPGSHAENRNKRDELTTGRSHIHTMTQAHSSQLQPACTRPKTPLTTAAHGTTEGWNSGYLTGDAKASPTGVPGLQAGPDTRSGWSPDQNHTSTGTAARREGELPEGMCR